jgi:ribosomal protein S6E (S10)
MIDTDILVTITLHYKDPGSHDVDITTSGPSATLSQSSFQLSDGEAVSFTLNQAQVSQLIDDLILAAQVDGKKVGKEQKGTGINVTLPAHIRNSNTPTGMADRIPPRVVTPFTAKYDGPDITAKNMWFVIGGVSDQNGRPYFSQAIGADKNWLQITTKKDYDVRYQLELISDSGADKSAELNEIQWRENMSVVSATGVFKGKAFEEDEYASGAAQITDFMGMDVTAPGTVPANAVVGLAIKKVQFEIKQKGDSELVVDQVFNYFDRRTGGGGTDSPLIVPNSGFRAVYRAGKTQNNMYFVWVTRTGQAVGNTQAGTLVGDAGKELGFQFPSVLGK